MLCAQQMSEKSIITFTNMDKRSQILSDIYIGIDSKNSFMLEILKLRNS